MKERNMWEYFGVEPGNPENIHVIGVDFGAGELAACEGIFQYKRLELNALYLNNASDKWDYTAYMQLEGSDSGIIGKEVMQREGDVYCNIYTNFKRPPEKALERYSKKLSDTEGITYKTLMGNTFYCLVKKLFESNEELCKKGRTILFVGRPASTIWEKQAKEYQEILQQSLSELEEQYDQKIDVIVYSEAEAAMAYEYYEGHVQKQETIAIIDGGCSTFDCVIVKDGRVINDYSRQVGAGMIEKNMLDYFLLGEDVISMSVDERRRQHREQIRYIDYTEGIHTLRLRKRKEDYFGDNGRNGDTDLVYSVILNGNRVRKLIDDSFMNTAIHKIPVRIERSYLEEDAFGGGTARDYPNFYSAVEAFVKGAKARCFDKKTGEKVKIDRVILTGGATVMPFIQEIIRNVFQTTDIEINQPSKNRHFSVAKGLTYMGYVELMTCQELERMKVEIHQKFENIRDKIYASIQNSCSEAIWKEIYVEQMNQWVENEEMETLSDWVEMPYHRPVYDVGLGIRTVLEQEKVIEEINDSLTENFRKLFPKEPDAYVFKVKQDDIISAFQEDLRKVRIKLKNILGTVQNLRNFLSRIPFIEVKTIDWDTKLSPDEKARIRDGVLHNKAKTMNSLSGDIESKIVSVKENIYNTLLENVDCTLEEYMKGLAPYFVRRYVDGKDY